MLALVEGVLGASVAPDAPLMDAGLDSLGAAELGNAIRAGVGVEVPVTMAFDYPSVAAMASYLRSELLSAELARATQPPPSRVVLSRHHDVHHQPLSSGDPSFGGA
eukprot:7410857-Pyramimonas_sp.AAC.1